MSPNPNPSPTTTQRHQRPDYLLITIAVAGFLGVTLGAFGAHALNERLVSTDRLGVWHTAVLYHLIHVAASLAVLSRARAAAVWWLVGVLVFSGSLYLLAFTDIGRFGAITPLGGIAFLIGWAVLIPAAFKKGRTDGEE